MFKVFNDLYTPNDIIPPPNPIPGYASAAKAIKCLQKIVRIITINNGHFQPETTVKYLCFKFNFYGVIIWIWHPVHLELNDSARKNDVSGIYRILYNHFL